MLRSRRSFVSGLLHRFHDWLRKAGPARPRRARLMVEDLEPQMPTSQIIDTNLLGRFEHALMLVLRASCSGGC